MTSALEPGPPLDTLQGRAAAAFGLVQRWMFSDPMAALLQAFGASLPASGQPWVPGDPAAEWLHLNEDLPEWLDDIIAGDGDGARQLTDTQVDVLRRVLAIERLTADDFNFRGGGGTRYVERSQAEQGDFSEGFRSLVQLQAANLGLVTAQSPLFDEYDRTLVLGGGYRSPLLRARYARLLQTRGVDLGALYFLGSPRPLIATPPEAPSVQDYAPGATDEFDLLTGAAVTEFGLVPAATTFVCGCGSADAVCPNWKAASSPEAAETPPAFTHERMRALTDAASSAEAEAEAEAVVLSASTGRPPYRPDTSDTFALWARVTQPRHGERILIVTTQVFVPFQTFDGVRQLQLPYGLEIDAVGFGAEWGDRPQTAEYLLQEVLSAIRSARRLLVEAVAVLVNPTAP